MTTTTIEPIALLEIDLALPGDEVLSVLDNGDDARVTRCLVRVHGMPVGVVELDPGWGAEQRMARIDDELSDAIADAIAAARDRTVVRRDSLPTMSVVIPTKDRPDDALACAQSVLACDYPADRLEVLAVDNGSRTSTAADRLLGALGADPRFRLIRLPRPGSSAARSRGAREARGELVAFTDDDVRVDREWLTRLAAAFREEPEVACVTGLVLPAELDTPAQIWFEEFAGFAKGFKRHAFSLAAGGDEDPLFPYQFGRYGSGNNMAFRRCVLEEMGWFDDALGPGTPTHAGEDVERFVALLTAGRTLVYDPAALVWHVHRRDYDDLRVQIYRYGVGLTAALTSLLWREPRLAKEIARRAPAAVRFSMRRATSATSDGERRYPRELQWLELRGMAHGPMAYLRSRRRRRARG